MVRKRFCMQLLDWWLCQQLNSKKAVIDFKYNSINDLGELDEELMIKALPKGKKREKALQFVMLMFPEVLNCELPIQAPSNLQFIATAVAMKKDDIKMAKWKRRHHITTRTEYVNGGFMYTCYEFQE